MMRKRIHLVILMRAQRAEDLLFVVILMRAQRAEDLLLGHAADASLSEPLGRQIVPRRIRCLN